MRIAKAPGERPSRGGSGARRGGVRALATSLLLASLAAAVPAGPSDPAAPDLLAELDIPVTRGAAAGYVPDRRCGTCHGDLWESYQEVGMARSFFRPSASRAIEDFDAEPYYHRPSRRYYQLTREGDAYRFRRWQQTPDGEAVNVLELDVDWVLGSGHHSRTYLFRNAAGELYQLPLAWYTEPMPEEPGRWGMAPGFHEADHGGVTRRVRRECMFCHNGYPEVAAGSDFGRAPQTFPAELPQGTGCQRCHGPGAEHVALALDAGFDPETVRAAIVNPVRLPPERRDDVCNQCHLQPSVVLPGIRRFDRADYSFRPGEALDGYLVHVDVDEAGRGRGDRFEINHHPYRLYQSPCWQQSGRKLSCLTCHDPHRKVAPARRVEHFRAACLSCHREEQCGRDHLGAEAAASPAEAGEASAVPADCVSCHMPKRRPQDVVDVVMTDHRIGIHPDRAEPLAPLREVHPPLTGVDVLEPGAVPDPATADAYRAAALIRLGGEVAGDAVDRLAEVLTAQPADADGLGVVPWLELANGRLQQRRVGEAEAAVREVLRRQPEHPLALEWWGISRAGQGDLVGAIERLRRAVALRPDRPEARFNLGRLLAAQADRGDGDSEALLAAAAAELEAAVALRPVMTPAWLHLGEVRESQGDRAAALTAYRRALEVEPSHTRAYLALGRSLLAAGERAEALRWWRLGERFATDPRPLADALAAAAALSHPEPP